MVKLVNYCSSQNLPLIIGCDASSHHVCYRTDARMQHATCVQPAVCMHFMKKATDCLTAAIASSCCFFYSKQGFDHRTVKSEPIWIKFCTHLLFYGIHFWADLDRNRRVGGSRPNQNVYVFVILVTHPKSYIETTDRRELIFICVCTCMCLYVCVLVCTIYSCSALKGE